MGIFILHLQNMFHSLAYYLFMQGSYVYDNNGNKYLDSLAGLWCTALGMYTWLCDSVPPFISVASTMFLLLLVYHLFVLPSGGSEPRLVKAATEQLNKLPFYHSFWNRTTKPSLVIFFWSFIVHLWTTYCCWWFSVSNFSITLHIIAIPILIFHEKKQGILMWTIASLWLSYYVDRLLICKLWWLTTPCQYHYRILQMKFSACSLQGKWERCSSQIVVQKQMILRYDHR